MANQETPSRTKAWFSGPTICSGMSIIDADGAQPTIMDINTTTSKSPFMMPSAIAEGRV